MDRRGRSNGTCSRPAWWKLYASVTLAFGLFILVEIVAPTGAVRTPLQLFAATILGATMRHWVRANRVALELQGRRVRGWRDVPIDLTRSAPSADIRTEVHRAVGRTMRAMTDSERPHWQRRGRGERLGFAIRG